MGDYENVKYHPDVYKGNNYVIQFNQINEAYNVVMSYLRGEETNMIGDQCESSYDYNDADELMRGMCDPDWDMWEEWMGREVAGIRDYSSHINPYI
ncbi:chaperone protein dnaJ 8, chloroplastic-like [Macadamia integrifolia]|uniref:chaperone protein dnaJ 8, chloroplastic-like n=1 Tax=Macadamia integrifolia TaxID=60698 RepID=UPI001C4FFDAB|nr:chaperone protein dnaJ 8, chloroplastic-like [Macadamia integrifolia]